MLASPSTEEDHDPSVSAHTGDRRRGLHLQLFRLSGLRPRVDRQMLKGPSCNIVAHNSMPAFRLETFNSIRIIGNTTTRLLSLRVRLIFKLQSFIRSKRIWYRLSNNNLIVICKESARTGVLCQFTVLKCRDIFNVIFYVLV